MIKRLTGLGIVIAVLLMLAGDGLMTIGSFANIDFLFDCAPLLFAGGVLLMIIMLVKVDKSDLEDE